MAMQPIWLRLGFSTQNQYRNAKAKEQINPATGRPFTSYRQMRDFRASSAGKPRNYRAEYERRTRIAQSRGFPSVSREQSIKKALTLWGIDMSEFRRMDRANARHWINVKTMKNPPDAFPFMLHRYTPPKNETATKYVGYVVSYYHAIVDPQHNWDSVRDENGRWRLMDVEGTLVPQSDAWWYIHFVQYSDKRTLEYYEARYGHMAMENESILS